MPLDVDEVAVLEGAVVGIGRVPEPAGDGAAPVGEIDLQVELSVAVGPQLLVRGQEDLVDGRLGGEFRNESSRHRS